MKDTDKSFSIRSSLTTVCGEVKYLCVPVYNYTHPQGPLQKVHVFASSNTLICMRSYTSNLNIHVDMTQQFLFFFSVFSMGHVNQQTYYESYMVLIHFHSVSKGS